MKKFSINSRNLWLGIHGDYDVVLFDPSRQFGADSDAVWLWVPYFHHYLRFKKTEVRQRLEALECDPTETEFQDAGFERCVQEYLLENAPPASVDYELVQAQYFYRKQNPDDDDLVSLDTTFETDMRERTEERASDHEDFARSEEAGWFYPDDDEN